MASAKSASPLASNVLFIPANTGPPVSIVVVERPEPVPPTPLPEPLTLANACSFADVGGVLAVAPEAVSVTVSAQP
jgi:hypothetical protein